MKALLVQVDAAYFDANERKPLPRLGLYYIAEYAYHQGEDVKIKQYYSFEPIIKSIVDILKANNCNIVGFYVDGENLWVVRRLVIQLKGINPNVYIIIGGPQVTGDPQLVLKRIPNVNVAIVGEGERPFSELMKIDRSNIDELLSVKGVAFIDKDGEYVYTGSQFTIESQDVYPFPRREKYSLDKNLDFTDILTGRGCIGKCAFCFEGSKKDNNLRLRSVESVIEEIDYIAANLKTYRYISFLDDTFILNPIRTRQICEHLIEKYNGDLKWYCEARVDILMRNTDLLPLMKRAGLIRVQLGGESGSQSVLDAYGKQMKKDDLVTIARKIYEAGIPSIYINFIIGGAHETLETFNETVEQAKRLLEVAPCCASVGCSVYTPYVGTPMRNNPSKYGIKIVDIESLKGPDGRVPCVETAELTQYKIMQLKNIFNEEIVKKQYELIRVAPKQAIFSQFKNHYKWGIASEWFDLCRTIEPIKNYHEALLMYSFRSIVDLTKESLSLAVPYRTIQPLSDGEAYYRDVFMGELKKNTKLEETLFMLSSGKISYSEILYLVKKDKQFADIVDIEEMVYDVFLQFDKEYMVVWKEGW